MGIAIGKQNIYQHSSGKLLGIGQPIAGIIVNHLPNLFITGGVIFFVWVLHQDLSKVFHMNSCIATTIKSLDGKRHHGDSSRDRVDAIRQTLTLKRKRSGDSWIIRCYPCVHC